MDLQQAYERGRRVEVRYKSGVVERGIVSRNHPSAKWRIFILLKRVDSTCGFALYQQDIESIQEVKRR